MMSATTTTIILIIWCASAAAADLERTNETKYIERKQTHEIKSYFAA